MKTLGNEETIAAFGLPYFRELSTFGALCDEIIVDLLNNGTITHLARGEYISRTDEIVNTFQVVLQGTVQTKRLLVPRNSVRGGSVYVVDDQQRLRRRPVKVLFNQKTLSVIGSGLHVQNLISN